MLPTLSALPRLHSKIDVRTPSFQQNREAMLEAVAQLRAVEEKVHGAERRAADKFHRKDRLLPRERIALLLDRGAPFFELSTLAGFQMHDDKDGSGAGGGLIAGIGYVCGVRVMVSASNAAIKGGTVAPAGLKKTLRIQEIVMQQRLPIINLVESGGANLMYQSEIFVEGGRGFANQARLSAMGIPQITVVHGSSTAGGAYIPGLSDYVIMVKGNAKVFLAGPPLLKAATGEIATDEELGGAEMHGTVAGTADYLAENDRDALLKARAAVAALGWNTDTPAAQEPVEPGYDPTELCGAVPTDFKQPYDVREVIARLVDDSRFLEFKADLEPFTICGRAYIGGRCVGLIGNNGPITAKGATKAAQFIQLCCQTRVPIVFLQNTTGYMVGREAEQAGIVKHGSKMIQAVANADVPRVTIVLGGSFGAGNYGMCGRGLSPDFIFSWPNAKVGVMGPEQAAGVMSIITRAKAARAGQPVNEKMLSAMENQIITRMQKESTAMFGTARLWDDGLIDPRDTRKVLMTVLDVTAEARSRDLNPNSYGVARL